MATLRVCGNDSVHVTSSFYDWSDRCSSVLCAASAFAIRSDDLDGLEAAAAAHHLGGFDQFWPVLFQVVGKVVWIESKVCCPGHPVRQQPNWDYLGTTIR